MDHGSSGDGDGHGRDGFGMAHSMGDFDGCHDHAGETTQGALIVAHSFTSGSGDIGMPGVDNGVDSTAHFGGHGDMDAIGASFAGAVDPNKQAFGVAVIGHGHLELAATVQKVLAGLGLLELYTPQGDRKRISRSAELIKPLRSGNSEREAVMPEGYFEGANGVTTESRSFWQLGVQSFGDKLMGRPAHRDPECRWNIDVSITQWYYAQSGDYETRILASVWSGFICKTEDADERLAHLKAARAFIKQMVETLTRCEPNQRSRKFREELKGSSEVVVETVSETVVENAEAA